MKNHTEFIQINDTNTTEIHAMVYTFGKYPPSYSIVNKCFADFKLNSTEHTISTAYKN